ncbi:PREDICTED: AP-2 complex subunit sigma-like [Ipomoea nil]|uniref:AP-2 complex subunit sigma-like n=1 Tax=Ipomoea nil TaxID=35883 RepID=UPI00090088A8|nr:PREDICTED: AP-2 complex subunit sigma-like [Ipomoea nil]
MTVPPKSEDLYRYLCQSPVLHRLEDPFTTKDCCDLPGLADSSITMGFKVFFLIVDVFLSVLNTQDDLQAILDHFFSNVCELDLVFNFHKVYLILDEFVLGWELQETSKKAIIESLNELEKLE